MGPQLTVGSESTHDLEERLLRGTFGDDELNAHLSTETGKARVLEILSRTDTGRRRAEEIFGPGVWGDRNQDDASSGARDNDPIGIGVGNDGDDSMFVDLVNQDDDEDKKAVVDHHHASHASEIMEDHGEAASWMDARKES
jgi:histone demethylase JARID1